MPLPRVLITTYHEAYLHRGGGEFEIAMIANALKKHGLITDIYGPYSQDVDNYDVILHFSVHGGGLGLLRKVKESGKPIVLSPNLFLKEFNSSLTGLISEHVTLADMIIFKSESEKRHFCNYFETPIEKIRIVPQFVDNGIIKKAPKGLFSSLYGISDYAIGIGIIEPNKNQLNTIRAVKSLGIPLVLVGNYRNQEYYNACKQEAGSNVLFLNSLPYHSDIMRSALQDSSIFIEVSSEPAGFSAIEAGLSGCNLVLGDSDWSLEHFGHFATYVNPDSIDSIQQGIQQAQASQVPLSELQEKLKYHLSEQNIIMLFDILQDVTGLSCE